MRHLLAAAVAFGVLYVADMMLLDGRYGHAMGQMWRRVMMHFGM
jgi:hypothetical protein